jgi:hypothetical protein
MKKTKLNQSSYKKAISPLIATILIIVVAVALIGILVSWGKDFTLKSIDDTKVIENSPNYTIYLKIRNIRDNLFRIESIFDKQVTIVGYTILSSKDGYDLLDTFIELDTPLTINPKHSADIRLACVPERNFKVTFKTSTDEYFTVNFNNLSPNLNYCDSTYVPEVVFVCDQRDAGGYFFSGDGSEQSPFGICDCQMLQDIEDYLGDVYYSKNYFKLLTNIDCSEISNFNKLCSGNTFMGGLDGDNYIISNLTIDNSSSDASLIRDIYDATFKNLIFDNATIFGGGGSSGYVGVLGGDSSDSTFENIVIRNSLITSNSSNLSVGGLIGNSWGSTFSNIHIEDTNIIGQGNRIGGIIGNAGGDINNSYFRGNIIASTEYVGGIAGYASTGTEIYNSYSIGNLTGSNNVGGIVGYNEASVSNSYFIGNVTGSNFVGGLFGMTNSSDITIEKLYYGGGTITGDSQTGLVIGYWNPAETGHFNNIYYNNTQSDVNAIGEDPCGCGITALQDIIGKIEGKTSSQLKEQGTFVNWNFTNIWNISQGNSYPYLRAIVPDVLPGN